MFVFGQVVAVVDGILGVFVRARPPWGEVAGCGRPGEILNFVVFGIVFLPVGLRGAEVRGGECGEGEEWMHGWVFNYSCPDSGSWLLLVQIIFPWSGVIGIVVSLVAVVEIVGDIVEEI